MWWLRNICRPQCGEYWRLSAMDLTNTLIWTWLDCPRHYKMERHSWANPTVSLFGDIFVRFVLPGSKTVTQSAAIPGKTDPLLCFCHHSITDCVTFLTSYLTQFGVFSLQWPWSLWLSPVQSQCMPCRPIKIKLAYLVELVILKLETVI
jgi:hypothetical protein